MKSRVILAILFIIPMIPTSTVMSSYYVGNQYVSAYGGKVNIYTPPYPINVFHSGQSNWISLPLPYWIQTGWRYYSGYQFPEKYVEYYSPVSNYEIYPQGNQNWGTMIEYKIINVGNEVWCAYINNLGIGCRDIVYAPSALQTMSEVHNDPLIELHTQFEEASYRDSSDSWHLFNQANWTEQFPYSLVIESESTFLTYRIDTWQQYLPLILMN